MTDTFNDRVRAAVTQSERAASTCRAIAFDTGHLVNGIRALGRLTVEDPEDSELRKPSALHGDHIPQPADAIKELERLVVVLLGHAGVWDNEATSYAELLEPEDDSDSQRTVVAGAGLAGGLGGASVSVEIADPGVRLIAEKRAGHAAKGHTAVHDAGHTKGELATAAACYAIPATSREVGVQTYKDRGRTVQRGIPITWPWDPSDWNPNKTDRIDELAVAGSLIAAEITRLLNEGGAA
jgi:hypothetical protein